MFRVKPLERLVGEAEHGEQRLKRSLGVVQLTALGSARSSARASSRPWARPPRAGPTTSAPDPRSWFPSCSRPWPAGSRPCATRIRRHGARGGFRVHVRLRHTGELVAWIIGWDLIIEYAVGNVAVAISWSGYFQELLRAWACTGQPGWARTSAPPPRALAPSPRPEQRVVARAGRPGSRAGGGRRAAPVRRTGHRGPSGVPHRDVHHVGARARISESAWLNSAMVALKLVIIGFFLVVGAFYVKPVNWTPFAPNGWAGFPARPPSSSSPTSVRRGVHGCRGDRNPQRDMPSA